MNQPALFSREKLDFLPVLYYSSACTIKLNRFRNFVPF
jgi:hypothetical protein